MSGSRGRSGLSTVDIRRSNLALVLSEVHADGVVSRSELAARTGLTRSAIQGLVGALVDEGLVVESRAASDGTPGRPSPHVRPVATSAVALAAEIAVNALTVAVIGLGGAVVHRTRVDRDRRSDVDDTVRLVINGLRGAAGELHPSTRLAGIGVAVAGQVDHATGTVSLAPNLGWSDVPLGALLATGLADLVGPDVEVRVGNEAQFGALAEHRRGAGRGAADVLYVAGEVGVGGGLILGGALHHGSTGAAGEIGHLVVHPDGRRCRCGSRGCWETEVSEGALLERADRSPDGGRQAVDEVVRAADRGDHVAALALADTAQWIGVGVGSLVNVLDPQVVVLGGWFAHGARVFLDDVDAAARAAMLPLPRSQVRVVPAQLGDDASLLGAAESAFESLLASPVN